MSEDDGEVVVGGADTNEGSNGGSEGAISCDDGCLDGCKCERCAPVCKF